EDRVERAERPRIHTPDRPLERGVEGPRPDHATGFEVDEVAGGRERLLEGERVGDERVVAARGLEAEDAETEDAIEVAHPAERGAVVGGENVGCGHARRK